GFATSSPADGFGLTIATSTLQYGDYYNFGNATTTGTGVFSVSLAVATTTHPYALNVSGSGYFTDGLRIDGYTTTSDLYVQGNNTTTQSLVLGTGATNLIDYADGDLLVSDDAVISGSATTSGTFIVSTAFGINTTTLPYTFNVSGTSYFTDGLLIAGYTTTSDLYVQGSATTTGTQIVSTAFGVNTTTLNTTFNVDGDTLLYGNATTTGSYYVGNDLTVANSVVLGDATSDTLTVNSTVDSDLIPQSNAYNLGSTANRWGTIYGDTINASNIVANNTEIGGTKAADFTINSDNATSDTENMSLTFKRGLPVTNAVLGWNAAKHQFTLNFPIWIEGTDSGGAASSTIVVKEGVNQGGVDLFKLLDISNNILLRADPEGHFAVGASYQDGYGFTVATTTYIEGQCVTGDTVLPIVRVNNIEYVRIDEIKGGEYVMSLNEKTGLLEPARINGLLDMGVKPIYKLTTESGKTIRTTGNHPYLVKSEIQIENQSSFVAEGFIKENKIAQNKQDNTHYDVENNISHNNLVFLSFANDQIANNQQNTKNYISNNEIIHSFSGGVILSPYARQNKAKNVPPKKVGKFIAPPIVSGTKNPTNTEATNSFDRSIRKSENLSNWVSDHFGLSALASDFIEFSSLISEVGFSGNEFSRLELLDKFSDIKINYPQDNNSIENIENANWTKVAYLSEGDQIAVS
ncbi:hypothetical protein KKC16_00830, partial [Patescibacteria group bacterium]|nr:hypothetical protein [Patescibacteria group bacterium]